MKIKDKLKSVLSDKKDQIVFRKDIIKRLQDKYGTPETSIIPSDYCYNRYNKGISFKNHLFIYLDKATFRFVGEKYPYTGLITHRPLGSKEDVVVGRWVNGTKELFEKSKIKKRDKKSEINRIIGGQKNIATMFEKYHDIFIFEQNVLGCKPTEQTHLLGRMGEFHCAAYTKGTLSKNTNQHGFDVIRPDNKKISVKTRSEKGGFVKININTFGLFDYMYILQYEKDEFKLLFYGLKEDILAMKPRTYRGNYELDVSKLKKKK